MTSFQPWVLEAEVWPPPTPFPSTQGHCGTLASSPPAATPSHAAPALLGAHEEPSVFPVPGGSPAWLMPAGCGTVTSAPRWGPARRGLFGALCRVRGPGPLGREGEELMKSELQEEQRGWFSHLLAGSPSPGLPRAVARKGLACCLKQAACGASTRCWHLVLPWGWHDTWGQDREGAAGFQDYNKSSLWAWNYQSAILANRCLFQESCFVVPPESCPFSVSQATPAAVHRVARTRGYYRYFGQGIKWLCDLDGHVEAVRELSAVQTKYCHLSDKRGGCPCQGRGGGRKDAADNDELGSLCRLWACRFGEIWAAQASDLSCRSSHPALTDLCYRQNL